MPNQNTPKTTKGQPATVTASQQAAANAVAAIGNSASTAEDTPQGRRVHERANAWWLRGSTWIRPRLPMTGRRGAGRCPLLSSEETCRRRDERQLSAARE